jgi:hypothetical protein
MSQETTCTKHFLNFSTVSLVCASFVSLCMFYSSREFTRLTMNFDGCCLVTLVITCRWWRWPSRDGFHDNHFEIPKENIFERWNTNNDNGWSFSLHSSVSLVFWRHLKTYFISYFIHKNVCPWSSGPQYALLVWDDSMGRYFGLEYPPKIVLRFLGAP